jgi:nucleoside-diphosphate-sugar epimerase
VNAPTPSPAETGPGDDTRDAQSSSADILLTGATGFLGRHIAAALVDAGHEVRVTVRATSDLRPLADLPVRTLEADVRSNAGLAAAVAGADAVVHCAGITRAARDDLFFSVNAEGTERLATAAAAAGVRRFVFVSSLAARGPDGAPGPTSAYGASKHEAEDRVVRVATESGGMEIRVLRPGGIYGPGDSDMVPLFRLAAAGVLPVPATDVRLQPVFVTDVAAAVRAATERPGVGAEPIAIAGDEVLSWLEMGETLAEVMGRSVRVLRVPGVVYGATGVLLEAGARLAGRPLALDRRRAADLARHTYTCDLRPARDRLGWEPRAGLREGLARTAGWYRQRGWLR